MGEKSKRDESYKDLIISLIGSRPVAYWPAFARRVGGVQEAVMLCQLLYWSGDADVRARDGWTWMSLIKMETETGLTGLQQQTTRRTLRALGVIDCQLKGVPRTWAYRINMDRLVEVLSDPHSTGKPFNGSPIEWENQSTAKPATIARNPRGMFTRETGQYSTGKPGNFNKNLETTVKTTVETTDKTTSSSSLGSSGTAAITGNNEEEGLSRKVIEALEKLGVFEALYPEIKATMVRRSLDDQQAIDLVDRLMQKYEKERAASLYVYRLKNLKKRTYLSGYTQSIFEPVPCSRCERADENLVLSNIDGKLVCQDCLTDEERQEREEGNENESD